MQRRRRLVLPVAAVLQRRQLVEEQPAGHHHIAARHRVRKDAHVVIAVVERIRAVLVRDAGGCAAALVGDLGEHIRDVLPGRGAVAGEELDHLGAAAVEGGGFRVGCEAGAFVEGGELCAAEGSVGQDLEKRFEEDVYLLATCACAIVLHGATLVLHGLNEGPANLGRRGPINGRLHRAGERDLACNFCAVGSGCQEGAPDHKVQVASSAEIVDFGRIPLILDSPAGFKGHKSCVGEACLLHS